MLEAQFKCLACVSEEIERVASNGGQPDILNCRDAVTLAPNVQAMPVAQGVIYIGVAVPTCLEHLNVKKSIAPVSRSGLIT